MSEEQKNLWITQQIEQFVFPHSIDEPEARKAFEFFAGAAFSDQRVRYLLTYEYLKRHFDFKNKTIAETGHLSGLSYWLKTVGHHVEELEGDFRYQIAAEDASVDVLLCLEVLEHIKDQDHGSFDDLVLFNYSGVKKFVAEMGRIVRPGGSLILSTPNPCSLYCIEQIYSMKTPWLFPPHVREYAPEEVIALCADAGFRCDHFTTMFAHHYFDADDRAHRLERYFPGEDDRDQTRGDDALFIFTRV